MTLLSDVRCIDYCKKGVLIVHESDVRCIDYCKKGSVDGTVNTDVICISL